MNQPLIFKKQIVTDVLLFIAVILEWLLNINKVAFTVTLFYLINALGITFIPSIRGFKYDRYIRHILYYMPMLLPMFIFRFSMAKVNNLEGIMLGILIGVLLLLSNYKQNFNSIFGESIKSKMPVDSREIESQIYMTFIAPICEELFYRYFIIGILYPSVGYYSIAISALLFAYSHFINRWANVMYNAKSYIYHLIIGVLLSILYIYTGSILGCIISHIIVNSVDIIVLCKRIKNTKSYSVEQSRFFDDY